MLRNNLSYYLMLHTALFNSVCLCNAYLFILIDIAHISFSFLHLGYWHVVCIFEILFCTIYIAFNQLTFLILSSSEKLNLKINLTSIIMCNLQHTH